MGEDSVLMNRYLHIKAKELLDGVTPTSTPTSTHTSLIPENDNIKRLVEAIGDKQLSVKDMLEAVGLKNRPNFLEYSLSPRRKKSHWTKFNMDSCIDLEYRGLMTHAGEGTK